VGYQEDAIARALGLGGEVAKPLKPAFAWQRRADQLNEQLKTARAAEEKQYGALVSAVVDGRVRPAEVPAKAA
jgi:hypothetical protein